MAWNAPNDKKPDEKDPWTGKPKKSSSSSSSNGPPMLDALIKNAYQKLKQGKFHFTPPSSKPLPKWSLSTWALVVVVVVVVGWILAGITHVTEDEQVAVFRLGVYQSTLSEGWYWLPVGVDRLQFFNHQKIYQENVWVHTITQDNNLADLNVQIDYQVVNPEAYLLNSADSAVLIRAQLAAAALNVASQGTLDSLLMDDQSVNFVAKVESQIMKQWAQHPVGVHITQIRVMGIGVPEAVKEIFNKIDALYQEQSKQKDAEQAREKELLLPIQTKINQLMSDAKNYAERVIAQAHEDVADFLAILPSYTKEPELTRYRLYSKTMEEILSRTNKVVVDEKAPAATLVLPPVITASSANVAPLDDKTTNVVSPYGASSGTNAYGSGAGGYSHV